MSQRLRRTFSSPLRGTAGELVKTHALRIFNGNPPTDNHEVEVILKSFQFVPLNALQQAKLDKLKWSPGGQIQFDASVQPDFRYQLQSSSNFFNWQNLATLLATNDALTFQEANSAGASARFYRVVTLP